MRFVVALAVLLLLASCGSESGTPEPRADDSPSAAADEVTTKYALTVLDDGDGAELCLGGVAESYPPQCGGPRLIGWDWSEHTGNFEEASGVRWGDFLIEGTFDGRNLSPSRVVPAEDVDDPPPYDDNSDFSTPCPEPAGGWPVPTDADNNYPAMDRAFRRASLLDGYADAWVDSSRDDRTPEQLDHDAASGTDDVSLIIVNVRVTTDVAAAEAEIRDVWSGALCVTQATYTDKELRKIQRELGDTPGILYVGVSDQIVEMQVVYDEGAALQKALDATYGPGMVEVSSALTPLE